MEGKNIFLLMRGGRRFVMPLTEENRDGLSVLFATSKSHIDERGDEHYQILAPLGRCPQGTQVRKSFREKYGKEKLLFLLNSQREAEDSGK